MVVAFQIVLLVIIIFSAFGVAGERESVLVRDAMLTVFLASVAALIVSVKWL